MKISKSELNIRISDVILTVVLICLCLILFAVPLFTATPGKTVVIYLDGALFAEKKLDEASVTDVSGKLTVNIENGEVFISASTCPTGQCEHSAKIKNVGDSIICLPNKIIVKIAGESEVDAISD